MTTSDLSDYKLVHIVHVKSYLCRRMLQLNRNDFKGTEGFNEGFNKAFPEYCEKVGFPGSRSFKNEAHDS